MYVARACYAIFRDVSLGWVHIARGVVFRLWWICSKCIDFVERQGSS